jgi:hypothetical protein
MLEEGVAGSGEGRSGVGCGAWLDIVLCVGGIFFWMRSGLS